MKKGKRAECIKLHQPMHSPESGGEKQQRKECRPKISGLK